MAHSGAACTAVALGASFPISTALDGALLAIFLVLWLVALPALSGRIGSVLASHRVAWLAVALFATLALGTAYSVAPPREAAGTLLKYADLLFIPCLATVFFSARVRDRGLLFFAGAVVANLVVSYAALAGLLEHAPLTRFPQYPVGFRLSITHSMLVSLGGFLFALLARDANTLIHRICFSALALVSVHNVLYVVIGRTGYLVVGALAVYFLATLASRRRAFFAAAFAVVLLLSSTYLSSPNFRERVDAAVMEFNDWRAGRDIAGSSVGLRMEWYRASLELIAERPLTGFGTGGFMRAYAESAGAGAIAPPNPHNDYLLIATQIGVGGLLLLVGLYVALWRAARALPTALERDLARGVVLAMAIGGSFNSFLLDHTEGLMFAWFAALLTGGLQSRKTADRP